MTMTLDAQPTLYTRAIAALVEHGDEPEASGLVDTLEAHCPVCDQPSLLITHDKGQQNAVFVFCSPTYGAGCALEALYEAIDIPRPSEAYREGFTDDPLGARTISEVIGATKEDEQMAQYTAEQLIERGREADPTGGKPLPRDTTHVADYRASDTWQSDVGYAEWQLTVREEAKTRFEQRKAQQYEQPKLIPMSVFMNEPDEETAYLVDRLLTKGGNVLLAAANKTGKSTLTGDLLRSLADGVPFLGTFAVEPRRVVIIDNELDPRTLRRWLRDKGIQNVENVKLLSLRGRTSAFQITDPTIRASWAAELTDTDVLIIDCFRPLLDALGLDENKDAGRLLVAIDELKLEAGISEAVVVHHMGHGAERARGDSRILDWPDAIWKMVRADKDDPASARYFSAFGRDVDVQEARLLYEPTTRRLTLEGGSRKDAARDVALDDVIEFLRTVDPLTGVGTKALEDALQERTSHGRAAIRAAVKLGKDRGQIMIHDGPRGAKEHRLNPMSVPACRTLPTARQQGNSDLASAPIGRGKEVVEETSPDDHANGKVTCDVCSQPLHPIHAAAGHTTCPSCVITTRQDTP